MRSQANESTSMKVAHRLSCLRRLLLHLNLLIPRMEPILSFGPPEAVSTTYQRGHLERLILFLNRSEQYAPTSRVYRYRRMVPYR